jgi:hypothetical protein
LLQTAMTVRVKALGLEIRITLLATAEEVIE